MSDLSDYKITNDDVSQNGVVAAPDRLTGTAQQNKAIFDRLVREAVKEKHNALIAALEPYLVWESYDAAKSYAPGNKVVYNGSSYLCTAACKNVLPTNDSCWRLIAARGVDGTGAGDMRTERYDPRGVETDIFQYVDERTDTYSKAQTLSDDIKHELGFDSTGVPNDVYDYMQFYRILFIGPEGYSITITDGTNTYGPKTIDASRKVYFLFPTYGTYTYTATLGSYTQTGTVEIEESKFGVYQVTLEGFAASELITTSGIWTSPVTGKLFIRAFGAGGGGGAGNNDGGGGGGGYMESALISVTQGQTFNVTIGAGGTGGQGSNGGNGGATSFGNVVTANGGVGGGRGNVGDGTTGGDGGSGGGGSYGAKNGGSAQYGGGGGGGAGYNTGSAGNGGNGGSFGGGGGGGGAGNGTGGTGGTGIGAGGTGTKYNVKAGDGEDGIDTSATSFEFKGTGTGGTGASSGTSSSSYGAGAGGGGGVGGNGGNGSDSGAGGGGGGFGASGGDSLGRGAGGGGGYGGAGGNGGASGAGGGGGYGLNGKGGDASNGSDDGGNGGYAAGGGGAYYATGNLHKGGNGGNGIVVLTYIVA